VTKSIQDLANEFKEHHARWDKHDDTLWRDTCVVIPAIFVSIAVAQWVAVGVGLIGASYFVWKCKRFHSRSEVKCEYCGSSLGEINNDIADILEGKTDPTIIRCPSCGQTIAAPGRPDPELNVG
jgi:ribosomal protein S27E